MSTTTWRRFGIALVAVAIWAAITIGVGLAQAGHGSLEALVSQRVMLSTPLAALFLLLVAWWFRWTDLGLNGPRPPSSAWLLWPIGVYVLVFAGLASLNHELAMPMLAFVAINTAVVGFSEELAFRGVLWGAARRTMAFWPGVLLVSALFGSVHLMNAFITGKFEEAAFQAFNASVSGFGYLALRIRTRSLIPIMIGHWLWDMAIFLNAADPAKAQATTPGSPLYGIALVAPVALYGLWLLRRPEFRSVTDEIYPQPPTSRQQQA